MRRAGFWRAGLAAVMLIAVAPFALAGGLTKEMKDKVIDKMTHIITQYAYVPGVDFSSWPQKLAAHKDDLDKAQTSDDFQEVINDALGEYKITHLSMQTPEESEQRLEGESVGIGVNIRVMSKKYGDKEDGILVIRVVPGSAAADAKLMPGDLIFEADGKPVKYPTELAGKAGESVLLTVKGMDGTIRKVNVTRRKFSTVRPEALDWIDKDTAVLHVYTFDLSYDPGRVDDLMQQASKAKNLVV
ncbi:MAG: PDZ domain-containing protein, partial [Armatimonadota bacterium]